MWWKSRKRRLRFPRCGAVRRRGHPPVPDAGSHCAGAVGRRRGPHRGFLPERRNERGGGRPLGVAAGAQFRVWVQCPQDPPPVILLLCKWLCGLPGSGGSPPQRPETLAWTQGSQSGHVKAGFRRGVSVGRFCVLRFF